MSVGMLSLLALLGQVDPAPPTSPPPLLLGRLLGAQSAAKVRLGVWFGNLSPGPMTVAFDSNKATALGQPPAYDRIGRGIGLVRDLSLSMTVGDYDFALGILSDELFAPASDAIGNDLAATVIQQLVGQLRTRALRALFGTEVWATVRVGGFDGPIDASSVGVRDGRVYFGGQADRWDTNYFSAEFGAVATGPFDSSLLLRFTTFSMPAALELLGELSDAPLTLQRATVYAGGLGLDWQDTTRWGWLELATSVNLIPGTGLAVVDYGPWGALIGLLAEAGGRIALIADLPIADVIALRPYVAFEAKLVSPIVFNFDLDDLNAPSVALPDWFLWGPQVGLEVRL